MFWAEIGKNVSFFYLKIFGGEIFYIFESACFRNETASCTPLQVISVNAVKNQMVKATGQCHYENMPIQIYQKILPPKTENFQIKNWYFHISAQSIDCGYSLEPPQRCRSNEYPISMFSSKNKKNNVYPFKPQFFYIKVGLRGSKLYRHVFVMEQEIFLRMSEKGNFQIKNSDIFHISHHENMPI